MRRAERVVAGLSVAVLSACGMTQLPPPALPPREVPAVDLSAPIAPGHGRVVIDVVDGPTPVGRIAGFDAERERVGLDQPGTHTEYYTETVRSSDGSEHQEQRSRTVANAPAHFVSRVRMHPRLDLGGVTPWVVDLPVGQHQFLVGLDEAFAVEVTPGTTLVRHVLPHSSDRREAWWLGVSGVVIGVLSVALGVSGLVRMHDSSIAEDRRPAGWLVGSLLAGGAAVATVGAVLVWPGQGRMRPGATATYRRP